jgi:hypothetical protein
VCLIGAAKLAEKRRPEAADGDNECNGKVEVFCEEGSGSK